MRLAVFGLGYVGAVTAACLADNGHEVRGVDIDPGKVAMIQAGQSPVAEPGLSQLMAKVVDQGHLTATTDLVQALERADVSLICVGTPSTAEGSTNLTHLRNAIADLKAGLALATPPDSGVHAVVIRSTVPPGTVESCQAELASSFPGRRSHIGVAMCPEFLREGTSISDFYHPPFTVVGCNDTDVVAVLGRLFGFLNAPFRVVSPRTAEALKYSCNAYHATKVSFVNELGRLFRRLGVDSREVMELFCEDTHLNISARYLRPGFAFGGSCLPKDLRTLLHLARMESIDLPLLAGSLATNRLMIEDVVERIITGPGRRVTLLGLSFKKHSDDLRESPYVDLAETLLGKGYEVRIFDPIVNPAALVGSNRTYVESKLPHLKALLTESLVESLANSNVAILSYSSPEVTDAVLATPPPRIIDLDGGHGPQIEALPGYEGVSW
jgi:GDP-mannose 6-dehydrogenase